MNLEVIDIVFIVIVLLFGFNGFRTGFFSQMFSILGILLGLILGYIFSDNLALLLDRLIGEGNANGLISFILIALSVFGFCMLLNKIFKESLEKLGAQGMDRIFGFCFGLGKGWIVVTVITVIINSQPFIEPVKIYKDSGIVRKILTITPYLENVYPGIIDSIEEFKGEV